MSLKVYQLRKKQHLPIPLPEIWSFFSDPSKLADITPPWMQFEPLIQPSGDLYEGMIAVYHLRPLLGIKLSWVTEITHVKEQELFVDEQRFGPYRFWHHEHHFEEIDGGIELTDIVSYAMPFGVVGRVVHQFNVEKKIQALFRFRYETLEKRFGKMK